jgi:hypothetical protein
MGMGYFGDWKKIYLFYGLIFFWLGWGGWHLSVCGGLTGLSALAQGLTADLRSYTATASDATSRAVAVSAPAALETVTFFYPESGAGLPLPQVQKILAGRFAQVEMRAVNQNVNFAEWFATRVVKYPGQVVAGLDLTSFRSQRSVVRLWSRTLAAPPLTQLAQKLNCLPKTAQITVKFQPNFGFLWEVSWAETDRAGATIPQAVTVWAETMVSQNSASVKRQPVLE